MAMERKLELLSPAGDWERLEMAVAYGADAVYLAGDTFGMRSFAGNFSPEELRRAADLCRRRGVALHVTCNTMPDVYKRQVHRVSWFSSLSSSHSP